MARPLRLLRFAPLLCVGRLMADPSPFSPIASHYAAILAECYRNAEIERLDYLAKNGRDSWHARLESHSRDLWMRLCRLERVDPNTGEPLLL